MDWRRRAIRGEGETGKQIWTRVMDFQGRSVKYARRRERLSFPFASFPEKANGFSSQSRRFALSASVKKTEKRV